MVSPGGPKLSKLRWSWASLLLAGDGSRRLRRLLCVPRGSWGEFVRTGSGFSLESKFGVEDVLLSTIGFRAVSEGWAEDSVLEVG